MNKRLSLISLPIITFIEVLIIFLAFSPVKLFAESMQGNKSTEGVKNVEERLYKGILNNDGISSIEELSNIKTKEAAKKLVDLLEIGLDAGGGEVLGEEITKRKDTLPFLLTLLDKSKDPEKRNEVRIFINAIKNNIILLSGGAEDLSLKETERFNLFSIQIVLEYYYLNTLKNGNYPSYPSYPERLSDIYNLSFRKDSWGSEYNYKKIKDDQYFLSSSGPDGKKNTADDINAPYKLKDHMNLE